jgi:hypothetical protein
VRICLDTKTDAEGNIVAASPQATSEALRAIREGARLGRVIVWGRLDAPIGNEHHTPLSTVPPEVWDVYQIDHPFTLRTPRSPVLLAPLSLHDPLPSRTLRTPRSPALLVWLSLYDPLPSRYRRKVLCNKRQAHTKSSFAQDTSQTQVRPCRSPANRESVPCFRPEMTNQVGVRSHHVLQQDSLG